VHIRGLETMNEKIKSIIKNGSELNIEVRKKVAGYIIAGFGLVAGLAWNDAIKTFIEKYFSQDGNTIVAKFTYAFLITLLLVFISVYLAKLLKIQEGGKQK